MARQITAAIYCGGHLLAPAADILAISLQQDLFDQHYFEVVVPFDQVEGPEVSFFSQAHKRLLGQTLTLEIVADEFHFNTGQTLRFQGLVTNIATSKDTDFVGSIIVRGFSPDYLLTDGLKRRTFLNQTLSAIFKEVLGPYPGNVLSSSINPVHQAPLPSVVQYDETNYEFLRRLAADYGEWFYYDGAKLCLGPPAAGQEVDFVADGVNNSFEFGMTLKPIKSRLYEYDYQKHQHYRSATAQQTISSLQRHPYGSFALQQSEQLFAQEMHVPAEMLIQGKGALDEEARATKANAVADLVTLDGHSDDPALTLGGIIRISGEGLGSRHISPDSFGTYRLIRLTHHVDAAGNYSNQFTALPHLLDVPPLPPHHDAPRGQLELAEVIDDKDPQQLGRLRVRYGWPVDNPSHAQSDWLRVLTPYSGHGKGHLMKPEVGSQVLVGHQGGLAEQPVVLGNLFHGDNQQQAKYSPDKNSLKGIQTAGGNKVVMQDAQGAQKITISNSNNKGSAIEVNFAGDGSISIQSRGPVSITGANVTLAAGTPAKGATAYTGEIKLLAKTITMEAEEEVVVTSKKKSIALKAEKDITADATANMALSAKTKTIAIENKLEISSGTTVDISGTTVKING